MKKIIVANWKMNPQSYKEADDLIGEILKGIEGVDGVSVVLCPPFTWLTDFSHKNKSAIFFGAQDVFYEKAGAYTGEISPLMLKNSGVEYVIVGHSERRTLGETNEIINKKILAALKAGLKVIFCVGEKEGEDKEEVLKQQLSEGLNGIDDLTNVIIAYEPVWAIGTGKNCSAEETKNSVELIKSIMPNVVRVLYGGSVNSENSANYMKNAGVDGLLVGGASLKAEEFIKIVASVNVV